MASDTLNLGAVLRSGLGVPIGVLNASLGSTPIEAWTSLEVQQKQPELRELLASWDQKAAEYDPDQALAAYEKEHREWEAAAGQAKADKCAQGEGKQYAGSAGHSPLLRAARVPTSMTDAQEQW